MIEITKQAWIDAVAAGETDNGFVQWSADQRCENEREALEPYRIAAMGRGWREGGGCIYDSTVFDSWKEAQSWSGEDDCGDDSMASSPTYSTWRECCESEGIKVEE